MRLIWISLSFLLGMFAGKKLIHFEHSGEGDSEFNYYLIVGFINHIQAEFEEENEYVEADADD